ncbi:DMT family transporter [Candidatus Daviesbacteria bacterium]|nr:DMT family transporter [Candidatus Daviesbacteria bacterium]
MVKLPGHKIFAISLPFLALIIAHLIWGANFVVAKFALNDFPPMTLAFLRYALASLLLVPFLLVFEKKELKIKLSHLPKLFTTAILMVTINIALFYEGLKRTSAIDASVLSMSVPIFSVLGGWWILKEKIYWINLVGIILGFFGTLVILGLPLIFLGKFTSEGMFGNLLILLSSVTFVIGAILSKQLLKTYHPLILTALFFLIATLTLAIPAVFEYLSFPTWAEKVSVLGYLSLGFITILSTICAFFLLYWGMDKIGVIKANLFHYMEPAVAASLAVPFLGERISYSFIIGTCLVVLGVYWGTLGKQEHHHTHHKHHRS